MDWDKFGIYITSFLGIALLTRIVLIRLHRAYLYLCLYLVYQIAASAVAWLFLSDKALSPYYDFAYAALVSLGWIFTWLVVFSLLNAMLRNLPGVLRLSRIVLRFSVAASLLAGLISSAVEISSVHVFSRNLLFGTVTTIERVISTVALVALLAIVAFVLWFKVEISKNLVALTVGFLVYFALKTVVYFLRVLLPSSKWYVLGYLDVGMTLACYLAWLFLLSAKGEKTAVRVGLSWDRSQQERLLRDLDAINKSLSPGLQRPS